MKYTIKEKWWFGHEEKLGAILKILVNHLLINQNSKR